MGNTNSVPATSNRKLPKIKFRVLVIGRANAGKTSLLQRVCDTTDSPIIYRRSGDGKRKEKIRLDPSMDRSEHRIEDELVFANHKGYIFHDSCGFEAGSDQELRVVQQFIRQRTTQIKLKHRLHAIWYCVPMDNQRPELDLKHFGDICPDKSVPVIVVFTKYDQFLRNVKIHLEDYGNPDDDVSDVAGGQFKEHYLHHLDGVKFVRLEKMHKPEMRSGCRALLEETAEVLNDDAVTLMLLVVQRSNLELSVSLAVRRARGIGFDRKITRELITTCFYSFPQIWLRMNCSIDWHLKHLKNNTLAHLPGGGKSMINHLMSLSIIANSEHTSSDNYHLTLAIILIFKHAAVLRRFEYGSVKSVNSVLTQVESAFQNANMMSKIQEEFTASYETYREEQFISFLVNTEIAI